MRSLLEPAGSVALMRCRLKDLVIILEQHLPNVVDDTFLLVILLFGLPFLENLDGCSSVSRGEGLVERREHI